MNLRGTLNRTLTRAFRDVTHTDAPALIQLASKPGAGEYQANGAMGAAKTLKTNPRDLAAQIVTAVGSDPLIARLEVAGPGFINIHLRPEELAIQLASGPAIEPAASAATVVVDYSSPNLAKEMHVGHLRSTIIGDALARVLEALGHRVIRQNHVGDWGTQFGMLLTYLEDSGEGSNELQDLESFYRAAKTHFDADPDFAKRSRTKVVGLQSGDPAIRAEWQRFIEISLSHCQATYDRLGTSLTMDDVKAESAYNDDLANVVADLDTLGLLTVSDRAECVFLPEFSGKDGKPLPVIVRKSDGGFLYSTTDLAAVRYRVTELQADRALYLTDARQALHFKQIFAVADKAGFTGNAIALEHHPFGNMLGKDGKPFRTRDGGVVKLNDLLDEAEARAYDLVKEKNPDIDDAERRQIARVVGIGAVKYADLSKNRTSDYIFDWDQMLSFDGNTAPYLQYQSAGVASTLKIAGDKLFFGANDGKLYCLGTEAGEYIWSRNLGSPILGDVLIEGHDMYVSSYAGNLYKFDISSVLKIKHNIKGVSVPRNRFED